MITPLNYATANGCVATGVQSVSIVPVSAIIDGCSCCSVNMIQTSQGISNQTLIAQSQEQTMTFEWQIDPSLDILVNNPVYVAGIICENVYPSGCNLNIRMSNQDTPLLNNNELRTRILNIPTIQISVILKFIIMKLTLEFLLIYILKETHLVF